AVFALGVMLYITASIIMQLLAVVIPKVEQWQQQGAVGQKKITQCTRYMTVALAIMQSTGLACVFHNVGQGFLGRPPHNLARIPVQFAKRVVGRRMYGGQSTYIPLKVNQAGVIPIIFASSVLYFPVLLSNVIPWVGVRTWINDNVVQPRSLWYILFYGLLIVF